MLFRIDGCLSHQNVEVLLIRNLISSALRDGQIKLLGKDNTQALLESNEISPSKFLQVLCSFPFICCFACHVKNRFPSGCSEC